MAAAANDGAGSKNRHNRTEASPPAANPLRPLFQGVPVEESSAYGLLAESFAYPEDRSWVIYRLRPAARWHDGKPVTPDDVIFSFAAFKQNSPLYRAYYQHVVTLEKVGEHDVKFTFDSMG